MPQPAPTGSDDAWPSKSNSLSSCAAPGEQHFRINSCAVHGRPPRDSSQPRPAHHTQVQSRSPSRTNDCYSPVQTTATLRSHTMSRKRHAAGQPQPQPQPQPIQITATLPYKSLQASQTNHCGVLPYKSLPASHKTSLPLSHTNQCHSPRQITATTMTATALHAPLRRPSAPRSSPARTSLHGRLTVTCMAAPAVICMGGWQGIVWQPRSDLYGSHQRAAVWQNSDEFKA